MYVDHSRMLIQSKMITFMVIIFLGCSAVAKESENCDRVQFSIDNQTGIKTIQNFTRQSFGKNGQPVYYSFSRTPEYQHIQTLIWWNNENNTWLSQTIINSLMPSSGNKITKT